MSEAVFNIFDETPNWSLLDEREPRPLTATYKRMARNLHDAQGFAKDPARAARDQGIMDKMRAAMGVPDNAAFLAHQGNMMAVGSACFNEMFK